MQKKAGVQKMGGGKVYWTKCLKKKRRSPKKKRGR